MRLTAFWSGAAHALLPSSLPTTMDCHAWSRAPPGLSFAVIRRAKREQPRGIVLARLICVRCKKDVKSVLRCRALRGIVSNLTDRIGIAKPGRFCVLRSYFGSGRDTLVCLRRYDIALPASRPTSWFDFHL